MHQHETIYNGNDDTPSFLFYEQTDGNKSKFSEMDCADAKELIAVVDDAAPPYSTFEPINIDKILAEVFYGNFCAELRCLLHKKYLLSLSFVVNDY